MGVPAERLPELPGRRRKVNRAALDRRQGLVEPVRLTDGITRGQLSTILREAAAEMRQTIELGLRAGTLGPLAEQQKRAVMEALQATSNKMWQDIQAEIEKGVKDAANLAVEQQLIRDIQVGMPRGIVQQYAGVMSANGLQSAEDILSRHTNGFTLSQRVYRNSQATIAQVGVIIDSQLAQQTSARKLAGLVRGFVSPDVKGGTSYAAMRLARTEINNAHHETTIRTSRDRPWVTGYRWHLSGSHPKPDICNVYAEEGDGSGNGFFAKTNVPSKPHPQCLCYLAIAQESQAEFIKRLQGGQYDDYLRNRGVPDQVRSSVLEGKGATAARPNPVAGSRVSTSVSPDDRFVESLAKAGIKDDDRRDQIVELNQALKDRYGLGFNHVEKVSAQHVSQEAFGDTMAYIRNGEILGVSPRKLTNSNAAKDIKSGWGAGGTGTISDVIVHEYGHLLMEGGYRAGVKQATVSANGAALKTFANQRDYFKARSNISRYGSTDRHEADAELFMNYHMGGDSREDWVVVWGETFHKSLGLDPTPLRDLLRVGAK